MGRGGGGEGEGGRKVMTWKLVDKFKGPKIYSHFKINLHAAYVTKSQSI